MSGTQTTCPTHLLRLRDGRCPADGWHRVPAEQLGTCDNRGRVIKKAASR